MNFHYSSLAPSHTPRRSAFTIMELMVAIAILVIIILSVGIIFNNASKSVSSSQALTETLGNIRGVEQQAEQLVSGMDKNCFLVIRSTAINLGNSNTGRFDQISFISNGTFLNRTGSNPDKAASGAQYNPLNSNFSSNAAHVWIGHLVMERNNAPDNSYVTPDQSAPPPNFLRQRPTGAYIDANGAGQLNETEFTLGIHTTLMTPLPPDAKGNVLLSSPPIQTFVPHLPFGTANPQYEPAIFPTNYTINPPELEAAGSNGKGIHIMSSRVAVAAESPAQLMSRLQNMAEWGPIVSDNTLTSKEWPMSYAHPLWSYLCYRYKALYSVYDTEVTANPFINGYFRTHPVAIQGVSSFKVEWTDGSMWNPGDVDAGGDPKLPNNGMVGQMRWFGSSLDDRWYKLAEDPAKKFYYSVKSNQSAPQGFDRVWKNGSASGDNYMVVFSGADRTNWPKALRFTYHIVDVNQRLQGGRDFVQIVQLPQ